MTNAEGSTLNLDEVDTKKSAEAGARLDLLHPATNAPTGGWLQLLGTDSDAYRAAQRTLQRRRLAQAAKSRKMKLTPEELEAEAIELLVAATVGVGSIRAGAEEIVFSEQAVRALYTKYDWIREQADEFIGDRANFLTTSGSSS